MRKSDITSYRRNITRLVFAFILLSLLYRYYHHVLLHQLLNPVIFKNDADLAYWLYHIAGIGKLIVQNSTGAIIVDCLLLVSCIISIIYPSQRIPVIVFTLLYGLYFISYNSFVGHHTHPMVGILLVTVAFWTRKAEIFLLVWQALRYYTIYIYASAFLWKIFVGGSVFYLPEAEAIVKDNLGRYLYQNPDTFFAHILYWFLQHPLVLYIGLCLSVLMQGLMMIGFFTKKFDRFIGWLPVFFHLSTYFFVDVCFFEILILNFTFIGPVSLERLLSIFKKKHYPIARSTS